ncbi:DUF302 domain-containing protein [Pseudomonas sp. PDM17]|nr:DUF302 domain-containing protein [Pseudomonas sp. PDM17]
MGAAFAEENSSVKLLSHFSFNETLNRVRSTLSANGMTVFVVIDHQAAARAVGLEMTPTTVLVYGNPGVGTPLMHAAPDFALELPLRVLIREDDNGNTWLVYDEAASLDGRHGLPAGMAGRLSAAEGILEMAIQAPTRRGSSVPSDSPSQGAFHE